MGRRKVRKRGFHGGPAGLPRGESGVSNRKITAPNGLTIRKAHAVEFKDAELKTEWGGPVILAANAEALGLKQPGRAGRFFQIHLQEFAGDEFQSSLKVVVKPLTDLNHEQVLFVASECLPLRDPTISCPKFESAI